MLDELDMPEERLAEEAFAIFLPRRRRRRAPARRHQPGIKRYVAEMRMRGDWAGRAEALRAAREELVAAARADGAGREVAAVQGRADPDLALRLAMAVTTRLPMAAPVHAQDLQKGIAALLERSATGLGEADAIAGFAALDVRTDAERDLVAAVGDAVAAGPLPDAGVLHSARSDLLAELASAGVSPEPRPDLGERLAKCFTQGEILALHDMRRPLPASLPKPGRDVRRDMALHLQAFAPLDDPARRPEPDPLPVIGSLLARPEARETFAGLARSFSLEQLHALRDPAGQVPEGVAGMGKDGRTRIAETFRAGPAPDREDTAPDPRLADDVLVLSCAVSERVDAASPVHRATLPQDVEAVLRESMLARDVPEGELDELAFGIARKRAETDLRVATARAIGEGEIFEVRARFDGNPDYPGQKEIDAYKAAVAKGMRRLHREEALPTETELRVARAVVVTHGTDRNELAQAMAEALERGTPATADEVRKERAALLAELQDGQRPMESFRERAFLRRIYRSFTAAELRELSQGRGAVLERLPNHAARAHAVQSVQRLHRKPWPSEPSPWGRQHDMLARTFGAEREQGPERDRGLGAEIGM